MSEKKVPGLAIFDLDYTLTKQGTWGRFVWMNVKYKPHLWIPLLIAAGWTQWRYKSGHKPRIAVKTAMLRWSMQGKSRADMEALAADFADREVSNGLRPGAIAALETHRNQGDAIIMASAAVDLVAKPIANRLGMNAVVSTDMSWDDNNKLKAEFASANCYGAEKLRRIEELLVQNPHLKQNHTLITMYSDSYSDIEILRFADVGVAVNPDRRLESAGKDEGFRVVDWNT
jgi:HAD superfamily hydrolase (TIGR01490 family)